MTFSVVGFCKRTGQIGVAATTAMPAVGKLASYAMASTGAIASQATLNPYLGLDGMRLLQAGYSAGDTLTQLISRDSDRHHRQLSIIDGHGDTAVWTGEENPPWAGSLSGEDFCAQGNRLAGPEVLEAVADAMTSNAGKNLAERLMLALEAGVAEGGDREGESSANIMVYEKEEYPLWDIRVDQHQEPVRETRRLFHLFEEEMLPAIRQLPKRHS